MAPFWCTSFIILFLRGKQRPDVFLQVKVFDFCAHSRSPGVQCLVCVVGNKLQPRCFLKYVIMQSSICGRQTCVAYSVDLRHYFLFLLVIWSDCKHTQWHCVPMHAHLLYDNSVVVSGLAAQILCILNHQAVNVPIITQSELFACYIRIREKIVPVFL